MELLVYGNTWPALACTFDAKRSAIVRQRGMLLSRPVKTYSVLPACRNYRIWNNINISTEIPVTISPHTVLSGQKNSPNSISSYIVFYKIMERPGIPKHFKSSSNSQEICIWNEIFSRENDQQRLSTAIQRTRKKIRRAS